MGKLQRSKAASSAGIAALIEKARKLHNQAEVMVRRAQEECKHLSVYRELRWERVAYFRTCPDCGKRWVA
jgi:hypothetical protein